MNFLASKSIRVISVLLILQAAAFYGLARTEPRRTVDPLANFPREFAGWNMINEGVVEKEVMEILKADEVITRWYARPDRQAASLFIAYFTTQRTGKTPHSPKNCLPGSGWVPLISDRVLIRIPSRGEPLETNRYVVAHGEDRSLVLYWYQTHHRTVASEYKAKIYTVLDSLRYNRSDTAVVKVTIPMRDGNLERATELATSFVVSFFDQLAPYFPS
ncbi:MAG: EpsI family protein [Acidobacteria bacterium]|nr:EpsI family protein [Acidobacteriota bacterium]